LSLFELDYAFKKNFNKQFLLFADHSLQIFQSVRLNQLRQRNLRFEPFVASGATVVLLQVR